MPLGLGFALACSDPTVAQEDIARFLPGQEGLVIAWSPEKAMSCHDEARTILELKREGAIPVRLLLTRPPSAAETDMLRLYSIPVDGELSTTGAPAESPFVWRVTAAGKVITTSLSHESDRLARARTGFAQADGDSGSGDAVRLNNINRRRHDQ